MKIRNRFATSGAILVCSLFVFLSGCKKSDDMAEAPSKMSTTVGTEVDDTVVTAKVKSALIKDPELKASDIKVETKKGEVMLSGLVDNQAQIERSAAVAKNVEGVKGVNNMLALKSGSSSTAGSNVDDSIVTAKVKSALLGAEDLKSMNISVETSKGDVQLSGMVDNEMQRSRAAEIAKGVEGVKAVTNQLTVKK